MLSDKIRLSSTIVLLLLFFIFMAKVMFLRFSDGDIYPEYSSLRSDPFGTKIFFESLREIASVTPIRNFDKLSRLSSPPLRSTIFIIALSTASSAFDDSEMNALRRFIEQGGRVVVSLPWKSNQHTIKDRRTTAKHRTDPIHEGFYTHFNISIDIFPSSFQEIKAEAATAYREEGLPSALPWHSELMFRPAARSVWKTLYKVSDQPVMIEAAIGKGTIVAISESYLFSNEGLKAESQPEILSYLIGDNERIIFNETHFHLIRKEGIMTLLNRYRLTGWIIGFLLSSLLFIWKNMVSTVSPPQNDRSDLEEKKITQTDQDHMAGLSSLYRKHIKEDKIFTVCISEYKRTMGLKGIRAQNTYNLFDRFIMEEKIIEKWKKDPIGTYISVSRFLKKER